MRNFDRNSRGRDSDRPRNGRGFARDSGPKEMHDVVCNKCKKNCQVPFKPTNSKPVYCSDCYRKDESSDYDKFDRNSRPQRRDSRPRFDRSDRNDRESHKVICDECNEECEVPFKPRSNKPIFCDNCFRKNGKSDSRSSSGPSKEITEINEKLDKIMKKLEIE